MKAAIVFIGINLLISNSLGQSINCDWFEYSTGKDAYCSSIDIDNNDNILVTGYFNNLILGDYDIGTNGTMGRHNAWL